MIRIIALLCNFGVIIFLIYTIINDIFFRKYTFGIDYFVIIPMIIFFFLNIYYILGGYRGSISLYLKRKSSEEEIKIQEAQNKLDKLKNSKEV